MEENENIKTQQEISRTVNEAVQGGVEEPESIGWGAMNQKGEPTPDTGLELFSNVLINTEANNNDYPELRSYIATGYMDNNELEALRRMHSVLSNGENVIQTIKNHLKDDKKNKLNMDRIEKLLLRKLFFLAYSSKSKNGFTVLELNSQHQYHHENLYQKQAFEEEEGPLAGIKEKMGKAMDKGMSSDRQIWPEKKKSNEIW